MARSPAGQVPRGRAPHRRDRRRATQAWKLRGRIIPTIGLNAVAGKDPKDFGVDPVRFDEMLPGCYDVTARLADMDLDGVHAQMCFPSFPGFAGGTLFAAEDKELATACVVAWNDFILDEWCAARTGSLHPHGDGPVLGRGGVGGRGASAPRPRVPRRSPSPRPRTGSACPRSTATTGIPSSPPPRRPTCRCACTSAAAVRPWLAPDANFAVAIALFGMNSQFTTVDLLLSPVFHKFPRLRVALSEGGHRVDSLRPRTGRLHLGAAPLVHGRGPRRAARPISSATTSSAASSPTTPGIEERDLIGVDNIMFEGDYPHSDSNFPASAQEAGRRPVRRSRRRGPQDRRRQCPSRLQLPAGRNRT